MESPAFKAQAVPELDRRVRIARVLANFRLDEFAEGAKSRRHKKMVPVALLDVYEDPNQHRFEHATGGGMSTAIAKVGLR